MLIEEAKWIGKELLKFSNSETSILNIGSSSLEYRKIHQPHIDKHIFQPILKKNFNVTHTDIINTEGVDIVGDLTDPNFLDRLQRKNYDTIICSNLLEHITEKNIIIDAIKKILPSGGIVIITVPLNYPYHLDPIDTMFRPLPSEISLLFNEFSIIKEEIVEGKSSRKNKVQINYWEQIKSQPKLFIKLIARIFLPFYKTKVWWYTLISFKNIFKPFSVSCVILKK